jgi:hypothetical protein
VGIELFNTYCERSGTGGHCVFNIYWLISGQLFGGGIELLRTYFDISGEGGQDACPQDKHIGELIGGSWNPSLLDFRI